MFSYNIDRVAMQYVNGNKIELLHNNTQLYIELKGNVPSPFTVLLYFKNGKYEFS